MDERKNFALLQELREREKVIMNEMREHFQQLTHNAPLIPELEQLFLAPSTEVFKARFNALAIEEKLTVLQLSNFSMNEWFVMISHFHAVSLREYIHNHGYAIPEEGSAAEWGIIFPADIAPEMDNDTLLSRTKIDFTQAISAIL